MRELLVRFVDWFRRDRLEAELRDELRFHRSALERDAASAAVPGASGRRLGRDTRTIEDSRERWSIPWLDHLHQDIRYALRGLRRAPGFAFGVIVTLALGIGANAAMFGVVDRLMFRPYPMLRDPASVNRVYLQWAERGEVSTATWSAYTRYLDLQKWTTSLASFAAFFPGNAAVGSGETTMERPIAAVSASYFDFFDTRPALGRFFTAAEDVTPVGAPVVVLSNGFWQGEFGGRDVIGQSLQVNNLSYTIVGVAPPGFTGVTEGSPRSLYIPITTFAGNQTGPDGTGYYRDYGWGWMETMVRRKPGVSAEQASTDLTNAFARSWRAERDMEPQLPAVEVARPRAIAGALKSSAGPDPGLDARTALWVTGVASIVLLIACANVANLFLGRALRRRREVALRLALGVSRRRLAAQSLTESLVLSLLGCLFGLVVAQWSGQLLSGLFLPVGTSFSLVADGRTLAVAIAAALVAAVLTGVVPAIVATKADLADALKVGARAGTYGRSRTRTALLVAQGALSVVLLVGAGLFVQSLDNVRQMRMGFDVDPILFVRRELRGMELTDSQRVALRRQLLETAQAIPEVEYAAYVNSVPFWSSSSTRLFVSGIDSVARLGRFTYQTATAAYFATMGTRILRGRAFTADDRDGAPPVTVVSQDMANALWPGKEALGQCIRVGADSMPCTTVVGIAENAVQNSLTDTQLFRYYMPMEQFRPASGIGLMLRMRGSASAQAEGVRKALQRVMPGQSYVVAQPLGTLIDRHRRSWQMGATMFLAFGALALTVAAIGLYAVIGYNVAQRMHELGVRIALGAQRTDVVRLVVGEGMGFALAGAAVGGTLALLAAGWVQPLLFRQSARDPLVYTAVAVILVLVAALASAVPAMRATRADPNRALRAE